ncbi:unnamed protein product, partial [Meganyctiphanes norvegica]
MAVLTSCCFLGSLKKGSIICGIYSMVYYATMSGTLWHHLYCCPEEQVFKASIIVPQQLELNHRNNIRALGLVMLASTFTGILSAFMLLLGLAKEVPWLMLPWVVNMSLMVLLDLTFVTYMMA